jgi:predicted MPP superfamily phosphohydrolase
MTTKTTKIVAIGDPHAKTDNIPEVTLFTQKLYEYLEENPPDIIVVLGDLLDTHERLHTSPLNIAYDFIKRLRDIAPTYVLVGNHDMCLGKNTPVLLWNGKHKMSLFSFFFQKRYRTPN